jgi:pyruvate ferredoxin oxidoreductase gamma subunit
MEKNTVEIRWHGRGGQGAKTACLLLADVAFNSGKHVQGFPEYGPERMGAPITAYNRITTERCTVHSNIYTPDYVIVVDETLLRSVDVTSGLKEDGAIIVNSEKEPEELRALLRGYKGKIYAIDARRISEQTLGKNFPNTPMLAAAVKVSEVVNQEQFIIDMENSFRHKFASKPQVVAGNMAALKLSMEEVKVG